jgi:hypothetical protein
MIFIILEVILEVILIMLLIYGFIYLNIGLVLLLERLSTIDERRRR